MNKIFTKIATAFVGMAMAIGVGVVVNNNKEIAKVNAVSGDVLAEFTGSICTSTTYARYSGNDSHSVTWVGCGSSNGTLGSTKKTQHENIKVANDDIAALKAVDADVAANDYGLYFYYTKTPLSNVARITLSGTISGNASATIYAITGSAVSTSSGSAYTQITLKADSPNSQGDTFTGGVDFTFDTVTAARYYGLVIVTDSYKKIADGSVKIYEGATANSPAVSVTSNQFLVSKNGGTTITAEANAYAPAGSTINYSVNNANASLSSSTGSSTTLTVSDSVAIATKITVTVTLKNSGGTTLDTKTKSVFVSTKTGDSIAQALPASEARSLVNTGEIDGKEIYVKGFANNSAAKYVWLSDNEDTNKTFEVYNFDGLSSYADGVFIVAHGNAKKYNSTTMEAEGAVVDSANYFSLSTINVSVDNTQYVDVTAANVNSGTIAWSKTAGTGDVTLSDTSNSGARITGNGVGTATVTATLGNLVRTISVTINKYATDWAFKDIILETITGFKTTYNTGETLDKEKLTVTLVEHSATLDEDREIDVTDDATFNFNSSTPTSFNLVASYTYPEPVSASHSTDDVVAITIVKAPTIINFGNEEGDVSINSTPKTGNDSGGNEWTITSEFSGNESFSQDKTYSQIGAKDKWCDSVTFTVTLDTTVYVETFSVKFGAFTDDEGDVTLKVGNKTVGSGSLNGTSDVVVSASVLTIGKTLTIEVTNMRRVKVYYISYTPDNSNKVVNDCFANQFLHMSDYDPELNTKGQPVEDPYGECETYYPIAKAVWNNMSSTQRSYFVDNSDGGEDYHDAYERLIAWAAANTDKLNGSNELVAKSSTGMMSIINDSHNSVSIIVVVASLVGITAVGAFFFLRKRKEER